MVKIMHIILFVILHVFNGGNWLYKCIYIFFAVLIFTMADNAVLTFIFFFFGLFFNNLKQLQPLVWLQQFWWTWKWNMRFLSFFLCYLVDFKLCTVVIHPEVMDTTLFVALVCVGGTQWVTFFPRQRLWNGPLRRLLFRKSFQTYS